MNPGARAHTNLAEFFLARFTAIEGAGGSAAHSNLASGSQMAKRRLDVDKLQRHLFAFSIRRVLR